MSNIHHIGDSAESISCSPPPAIAPLYHPLVQDSAVDSGNYRDALDNCAATLYLLADLFGDTERKRYPVLDSDESRAAMFRTMLNTAQVIKAVSVALKTATA